MIGGTERCDRTETPLTERVDAAARTHMRVRERAGLQVLEAALPGPFHAFFTTRLGGVSTRGFTSLNLDARSDDAPEAVAQNRARVAAAVADGRPGDHAKPHLLVSPAQAHGVRVVGAAEYVSSARGIAAAGTAAEAVFQEPCDGLTLHPLLDRGLAAVLLFADCVPVIMVGEVDMALVHAGWRGLVGGVVEQAGRAMTGPPGLAFIGPSIGPCCFTVGDDVAQAFAGRFGPGVVDDGRVDLWAAAVVALGELGVRPGNVVNPRLCTVCNRDLFYSFRADGPVTGRHGAVAWAEEAA